MAFGLALREDFVGADVRRQALGCGVVRWRLQDLLLWIFEAFQILLSRSTLSRELKALGVSKTSPRPRHPGQNEEALEGVKKSPRSRGGNQPPPPGRDPA
tara:strand:- start:2332 stop:2631 length:300 start_codon:yes stop_codon:yes gene_type:complete